MSKSDRAGIRGGLGSSMSVRSRRLLVLDMASLSDGYQTKSESSVGYCTRLYMEPVGEWCRGRAGTFLGECGLEEGALMGWLKSPCVERPGGLGRGRTMFGLGPVSRVMDCRGDSFGEAWPCLGVFVGILTLISSCWL